MSIQPFLIASPKVGLERDIEPWLLPDDAYPELEDCYMWRGRIKKKQGYSLLGRLNRLLASTDGSGNLTVTIPGFSMTRLMPIGGSYFVVGSTTYKDAGGTGSDPQTLLVNGIGTATLDRGGGGNPGQLIITGGPVSTPVFYYSGLPVMGLPSSETTVLGQLNLLAFDTTFSYIFNGSSLLFTDASWYWGTAGATIVTWSGTDSQFFWTTNYAGAMWTTNNVPGFRTNPVTNDGSGDGIRWYDQTTGTGWVNFLPPISKVGVSGTTYLNGCLMILPYKGRLIVFNTREGDSVSATTNFPQRARWSEIGTPYYTTPIPNNYQGETVSTAWASDIVGKGGFVDAPTSEQIVSAQFIKDTLVVFFEDSTWQLAYTGNILLPFIWVKINTELGAKSTFSEVPFDKVVLGIGDVGIHACDSVNVERIDQKIPDDVFDIQNSNSGRQRVYGIRDYYTQLVYWSVPYLGPDEESDTELPPPSSSLVYPNKIFVYNYIDQSFSSFNDSFTCFGYYQLSKGLSWENANMTWADANFPWVSAINQPAFPYVVGGNQQGYVEVFDPELVLNGQSLFISTIAITGQSVQITSPNHNLTVDSFVNILLASGTTGIAGAIYKVISIIDANNFTITVIPPTIPSGVFTGNGNLSIVSNINIVTKRFNPFMKEASQVRLSFVDFYFETTTAGQLQVNLFIDEDSTLPINSPTGDQDPTNIVATYPETTYGVDDDTNAFVQNKIWKRVYFSDISQLFQMQLTMNNAQMMTLAIAGSDITLHGLILWFAKSGRVINV